MRESSLSRRESSQNSGKLSEVFTGYLLGKGPIVQFKTAQSPALLFFLNFLNVLSFAFTGIT